MDMPVFQELSEHLRSQEYIGHGPVAVGGNGNLEAFAESIETMTRYCWEEAFTEEHCAQAQREFDVSPAQFLLHLKETSIEGGVVCNKQRVLCECKEFGENGHNGRCIAQCIVSDLVDPLGIRWNQTFRIYE